MNTNIKYIKENFIESNELCKIAEIELEELEKLIEKELIPNASYSMQVKYKITSPLGDEKIIEETKKYFAKSTIELLKRNIKLNSSAQFKEMVKKEFTESFLNSPGNKFGYDNILNQNGIVDSKKLDLAFEEEWKYFLQGIYGICTLNGTGVEIAKKEIAVKKLIAFNERNGQTKLTENETIELLKLNEEFNKVSNLFAPYQRENSSRGKYLDKILEINSLSKLKKKYS